MNIRNLSYSIVTFISLLFINCAIAQNKYDFNQFWNESLTFAQQPLNWQSNDWLKLGIATATTIAIMQADQPIKDAAMKDQSHINNFYIKAGKFYGEIYPAAIVAGGFGLYGYLADDQPSQKIAFETVQTILYAGAITSFLKIAVGRARPYKDKGNTAFKPFSLFDNGFQSLPSGHATLAFSLSTVLANNTKSDVLKVLFYVPAVLTCVSRIYQNQHWTSDVLVGAAIGYFVGNWVSGTHESNEVSRISFTPPFSFRIAFF
jgi:membrane-associated phospholipid phosphatase